MSREPSLPARQPAREQLYVELGDEVRASQRATDVVDDLVCQILGVNRTDARCLDILDQHGSMSAGDLAQESRLTTGAITAVIDRLERAGLARRVPDPSDRRRVLLEPTEKAFELTSELMVEPMRRLYTPMAERYSEDDLRLILEFTRKGRELQERHADWLRERLKAQSSRTSAP
jgi:DNA-binding MarR family transcriptional regulator